MHSCPDCDMACYCGGDIDDCEFTGTEEQMNCTHYLQPECDGYEGDDDDHYYPDEEPPHER